jgi:predicted amidohydrolase YtcJ
VLAVDSNPAVTEQGLSSRHLRGADQLTAASRRGRVGHVGDQLYVNGKVFTGEGETQFASAFRITDGAFSWVGDSSDVAGEDVVDLRGRTVLPGFLDLHTHPASMSTLIDAVVCLPPAVNNIAELIAALKTHQDFGASSDLWIEGWGYDESKLAERRKPTAEDLDQVSTSQPVFIHRSDGHSAVCNTRALQAAGIGRDTPDPPGARFERDNNGAPNGILTEVAATQTVYAAKPSPTYAEQVNRLAGLNDHFAERGIVAIADLLATLAPYPPLKMFRDAAEQGLRTQAALYYGWSDILKDPIPDLTDSERTGRVKFAGLKLFLDGVMSNRTAWIDDTYPNSDEHGIRIASDDELRSAAAWARRNKVQVAIHAMGDRALQHVIELFAVEEPWMGDLPSIRLEHATLLSPIQIRQINTARMRFGVVSHTIFFFAEYDNYLNNLTPAQFERAYPISTFYDNLPNIALSSDRPATTWADADNVFTSIKAAVVRKAYNGANIGQAEAITVPQAILLYTGRARALAPLDGVGSISPGQEASFIVLDRDIFTIPAVEIDEVQVSETHIQGERVYERA